MYRHNRCAGKIVDRAARRWFLISCEVLERRVFLSTTNSWINPLGGDFDTSTNWSLGHVPLATEDAVINLPGTYVVTHSSDIADSVNSLTSTMPFTLSAGSVDVATTVQVDNTFTLSGGTLTGATVLSGTSGEGLAADS